MACSIVCFTLMAERIYRLRCQRENILPHDHIRPMVFLGFLAISASLTGIIIYVLLSWIFGRTFFPGGYAMALLCVRLLFQVPPAPGFRLTSSPPLPNSTSLLVGGSIVHLEYHHVVLS